MHEFLVYLFFFFPPSFCFVPCSVFPLGIADLSQRRILTAEYFLFYMSPSLYQEGYPQRRRRVLYIEACKFSDI